MSPSKKNPSVTPLPYVLKKNYVQVTLADGKPFSLDSTHPTFDELVAAIKEKNWKKVPRVVNVAENIRIGSHGLVEVLKNGVFYKGAHVHSSLTARIMDMLKEGKDIKFLLRFMDNLFQNPSQHAKDRFYDWLMQNDLPITDDGCCLAYKSVDSKFKDTHTHTVDNSPGQIIMMSRGVVNTDYSTQCATGFHVCSKLYGLYGTQTLAVKFNPKHILSAVDGKMRVTKYEVLALLGAKDDLSFKKEGFSKLEKKLVIEVKKERRELVEIVLKSKVAQRLIRQKKIKKTTIMRYPYAKLKAFVQRHGLIPNVGPDDPKFLQSARKAANISAVQLGKIIKMNPKKLVALEADPNPTQEDVDRILDGIAKITGRPEITFPKPLVSSL